MVPEVVVRPGRSAPGGREDGDDLLAPALAGPADDHGVGHRRVRGEGLLDLLGEHLLAAGVDRDRVAAQQVERAVGPQRTRSPATA